MSATTKNMRTHLSSCDAVPSPLGPLMIGETLEYEEEERRASGTQALITQLNAKVYPRRSREEHGQGIDQGTVGYTWSRRSDEYPL
ncbi:hypothetical protein PPTG_10524 [Phytophthora nicotianae INRA-310]|uniref:Uncharacterized protein n=1 Tax=Phytophthora nicotianae (strain INRA-310) TaxID=761204 RepID=W2QC04_PHYN3|nr:hypothetical protein PPTG_10524 [Phytophthora nicotianae INRA-310]ETN10386.1 hypothetical protein PPTG_10524 [Phytophthora nicotianae INRA-310]